MTGVEATTLQDEVLDTIVDSTLIGLTGTYQLSSFIIRVTRPQMITTIKMTDIRNGNIMVKKREWHQLMYTHDPQRMLKTNINDMKSKLNEAYQEGLEVVE
jgi:hypothetical protein